MTLLAGFMLALWLQAPAPPSAEAPVVEAYAGSLADGLTEIESASDAGELDRAREIGAALLAPTSFLRWRDERVAAGGFTGRTLRAAEPVLDFLALNARAPSERAAVHYALGVASARGEQRNEAVPEFERARELAGASELRLDATYNLGVLALEDGEELRKEIPELNPNAAPPTPPAAAVPGAPPAPDPLELARAAYLRARSELLERWKSDWRDADTRANLELVQRRLKELDAIEKQRQEQQEQQQDQQQDSKDSKDSKEKKDEQDPKQQPEKPEDQKDQGDQQKPEDQKPEDEKPEDQPKPEDQKPENSENAPPPQGSEPKEELLTKEEMMRLFDLLQQTEEQGKRLEQELRQVRRAKVKKDW